MSLSVSVCLSQLYLDSKGSECAEHADISHNSTDKAYQVDKEDKQLNLRQLVEYITSNKLIRTFRGGQRTVDLFNSPYLPAEPPDQSLR